MLSANLTSSLHAEAANYLETMAPSYSYYFKKNVSSLKRFTNIIMDGEFELIVLFIA